MRANVARRGVKTSRKAMRALSQRAARARRRRLSLRVVEMLVAHAAFLLDPVAQHAYFMKRRGPTKARQKGWAQNTRRALKTLQSGLPPEEAPRPFTQLKRLLDRLLPPLPWLLTRQDLQGILFVSERTAHRIIQHELKPLPGAVVQLKGMRGMRIHTWALAALLHLPDPRRCPVCRRAWEKKPKDEGPRGL